MGELTHWGIAFLSEECGPCVEMRGTVESHAQQYPDFPIFATYSEEVMDSAGVEVTPSYVEYKDGEVLFTVEGYISLDDLVQRRSQSEL